MHASEHSTGSWLLEALAAAVTVTDSDAYFSYLLGPFGLKFHGFVGLTLYVLAIFLSRSSREAWRKEFFSLLLSFHSCTKSNSLWRFITSQRIIRSKKANTVGKPKTSSFMTKTQYKVIHDWLYIYQLFSIASIWITILMSWIMYENEYMCWFLKKEWVWNIFAVLKSSVLLHFQGNSLPKCASKDPYWITLFPKF